MDHNIRRFAAMDREEWKHALDKNKEYNDLYSRSFSKFKRATNAYYHLFNKIDELYYQMCDYPDDSEPYKQMNKRRSRLYLVMYEKEKEMKLLELEIDILSDYSDHYLSIANRHLKYSQQSRSHFFTKKTYSVRTISKAKRQQVEKEVCAICFQTHSYKDLVETTCSHIYGKSCFQQYISSNKMGQTGCCPMCRTKDYDFYVYSLRK